MMKIKLLTPVEHDGKKHAEGSVLSLGDDAATALINCGAAEKPGAPAKAGEPADAGTASTSTDAAQA
jgi:hypothetical protein